MNKFLLTTCLLLTPSICFSGDVLDTIIQMDKASSLDKIANQVSKTTINHFPDRRVLICELEGTLSHKHISGTEGDLTLCKNNFAKMFPDFKIIDTLEVNSKEQYVIFEIGRKQ